MSNLIDLRFKNKKCSDFIILSFIFPFYNFKWECDTLCSLSWNSWKNMKDFCRDSHAHALLLAYRELSDCFQCFRLWTRTAILSVFSFKTWSESSIFGVWLTLVSRYQTIRDLRLLIFWCRHNARRLLGRWRELQLTKQRPLHFWKGEAFPEIVRFLFSPL